MTQSRSAPPRRNAPPRAGATPAGARAHAKAASAKNITTPLGPIVVIAGCTLVSIVLTVIAIGQSAGSTDEVSLVAVAAWVVGSVLGLLAFSWFRSADMGCRAEPRYVEPGWRPRRIAVWLAVVGWIAGSFGAFLVAEALARR